jgi:hypothetical protein
MKISVSSLFVAATLCSTTVAGQMSVPNMDVGAAPPEDWNEIAPIIREHLECRGASKLEASVLKAFQSMTGISPPRNFALLGLQVQTILLENNHLSATLAAPLELVQKVISLGTVKYITSPGDSPALTHIACVEQ